jgi:hypothetical protein
MSMRCSIGPVRADASEARGHRISTPRQGSLGTTMNDLHRAWAASALPLISTANRKRSQLGLLQADANNVEYEVSHSVFTVFK